ncbi:MAG: hypothetical protein CMJ83_15350 [Planctomycetes bacterium]|nr:hypothetical protein [Planctomycetota bacterium]
MVDHLPKDQVRLLHLGGRVVDLIAVLRFGRRFRSLDDGRARRLLAGLADSRLRSVRRLHFVLKMTTQYAYFTGEATWKVTGFDGPWQPGPDVPVQPPPQLPSETGA